MSANLDKHDKSLVAFWKNRIKTNVENGNVEGAQVGQRVLKQMYGIDIKFTINGKIWSYEDQLPLKGNLNG